MEHAFDRIKDNSFLYAISKEPVLHMYECRECLVKKYVIVYAVSDEVVFLIGLFHQKQLYNLRFLDREAYGERMIHDEMLERMGLPMPTVSRFSFMTDDEIKRERLVSKGRYPSKRFGDGKMTKGERPASRKR